MHHHGLIHRDIKPENVVIAFDGSARLADLGCVARNGSPDCFLWKCALIPLVFQAPCCECCESPSAIGMPSCYCMAAL